MLNPVLDRYIDDEEECNDAIKSFRYNRFKAWLYQLIAQTPSVFLSRRHLNASPLIVGIVAIAVATVINYRTIVVTAFISIIFIISASLYLIRRYTDRRTVIRNEQTRLCLYKLLGSIGAAMPPFTIPVDTNTPSYPLSFELSALEETLQANVKLIHKIDEALLHLRRATALQYRLGSACPNVERIERAATTEDKAASWRRGGALGPTVSLLPLRRGLAHVLTTQHRQVRLMRLRYTDDDNDNGTTMNTTHESTPGMISLSYIRSSRNLLVAALSDLVSKSFGATRGRRHVNKRRRQMKMLWHTSCASLAYLEGLLIGDAQAADGDINVAAADKLPMHTALESFQSKVRTLQILVSAQMNITGNLSDESEQWQIAVQMMSELDTAMRSIAAALSAGGSDSCVLAGPSVDDGLPHTVEVADATSMIEYVAQTAVSSDLPSVNQHKVPRLDPRTVVFVGKGAAISKSAAVVVASDRCRTAESPQYHRDPAQACSLVNELKAYLQSLPKALEVEPLDDAQTVSAAVVVSDDTGLKQGGMVEDIPIVNREAMASRGRADFDTCAFLQELRRAMPHK